MKLPKSETQKESLFILDSYYDYSEQEPITETATGRKKKSPLLQATHNSIDFVPMKYTMKYQWFEI